MIAVLAATRVWVTRAEMKLLYGLSPRECRLGRQWAHGRIIMGQDGFKLLRYATPDEIRKCSNVYLGQIEALKKDYSQLTKRAHAALARKGQT